MKTKKDITKKIIRKISRNYFIDMNMVTKMIPNKTIYTRNIKHKKGEFNFPH
jgi:hypothetical protein